MDAVCPGTRAWLCIGKTSMVEGGALSQQKRAALTTQDSSAYPSPRQSGYRNSKPGPRNLHLISLRSTSWLYPPWSAQSQVLTVHASRSGEAIGRETYVLSRHNWASDSPGSWHWLISRTPPFWRLWWWELLLVLIAWSLVFDGIQDWGLPEIVPCLFLTPES